MGPASVRAKGARSDEIMKGKLIGAFELLPGKILKLGRVGGICDASAHKRVLIEIR